MEPPNRDELLDVLLALVIDTEEVAWQGFSVCADDDASWRLRLAQECLHWSDLITRGRRALEASGIVVPTPLQIREDNERKRAEELQQAREERKRKIDARRCKSCGRVNGHNKKCQNRQPVAAKK